MDITNGSTSTAPLQQWSCNTNAQQDWTLISVVAPNGQPSLLIKNDNSGKCLSILNNGPNPGGQVIQWTCNTVGGDYWEDWQQGCSTGLSGWCWWYNLGDIGAQKE
jgi:hypothetical protein